MFNLLEELFEPHLWGNREQQFAHPAKSCISTLHSTIGGERRQEDLEETISR